MHGYVRLGLVEDPGLARFHVMGVVSSVVIFKIAEACDSRKSKEKEGGEKHAGRNHCFVSSFQK